MKNQLEKLIRNSQYAIRNTRKAFTLIEMLIVVAIIGILASAIMVGLGPAQQKGRDARRMSDLRETQNALELFYTKYGDYPNNSDTSGVAGCNSGAGWSGLQTCLQTATIGAGKIPNDPNTSQSYCYDSNGTDYIIGATLEQPSSNTCKDSSGKSISINGLTAVNCANDNYCISF